MTLEWLLLFAAIVGVGATSALIVERVVSTSSEVPADIEALAISAEIEAAAIEDRANRQFAIDPEKYGSAPRFDRPYKQACKALESDYSAVVRKAKWQTPVVAEEGDDTVDPPEPAVPAVSAKCELTRRSGLAAGG